MASDNRSTETESQSRERIITEALTNKRRVLDEELNMFKAIKDQEFRAFEAYLRRWPGEPSVAGAEAHIDNSGLRHKIKQPKSARRSAQPFSYPKHRSDESIIYHGHVGNIGEGTLGPEEEAARIRVNARRRTERRKEHERESEFQGVITPSYLPLLGSGSTMKEGKKENVVPDHSSGAEPVEGTKKEHDLVRDRRVTKKIKNPLDKSQMRLEIANARRATTPVLSSSAEYHPPPLTSPPIISSRPLSSSVPPEHQHDLDQRRSSGRSDISIDSLKSSLKNPTQPKSPKKVQFSIDNIVVSPSTSPLAIRPASASESNGPEKYEILKGKRDGKSSTNGTSNDQIESSSSAPTLNGSLAGMTSLGSYFQSKRDSSITTTNPTSAEDFDILDNEEDVFAFDEDISAERAERKKVEPEEGMIEDDIEEEDVGNEPPLTGSSPHAGSLPIEIKLPSRRAREAEDG